MILIADSGSTKTEWVRISQSGQSEAVTTSGLNPLVVDRHSFVSEITSILDNQWLTDGLEAVYFYGAGCLENEQMKVMNWLHELFPSDKIEVHSDLLGACRAVCQTGAGLVGILGTGSNFCHYDGERIVEQIPSLGYLLGDEGSGMSLGRYLLKAYYRGRLPEELEGDFQKSYPEACKIETLYDQIRPNSYLASLVPFLAENKHHVFVQGLLRSAFAQYIDLIHPLTERQEQGVNFVGSVAYYFKEEIADVLHERGFTPGKFVASPLNGLTLYHSTTEK